MQESRAERPKWVGNGHRTIGTNGLIGRVRNSDGYDPRAHLQDAASSQ